jgi:hypothetical protein
VDHRAEVHLDPAVAASRLVVPGRSSTGKTRAVAGQLADWQLDYPLDPSWINASPLSLGKEFGQRLSDRTRRLGWRQMPAPCEYLQPASGDRVGVLLCASRWHDAVVLARSCTSMTLRMYADR